MSQITVDAFKAVFTATSRATPEQVAWALRGGLKKLRKIVGAAAVDDYLSSTPSDTNRADDLEMGHAHLAYCVLALNAGSRVREGGILKVETQTDDDKRNEYLPPKDIAVFVVQHTAEAMEYLEPYLISETILEGGGVEFCHPAEVGCDYC